MKIVLEKVKSSGTFTMEDNGTLAENLEVGDVIDFSAANIKRTEKVVDGKTVYNRVDLMIYEKGNREESPFHIPLTEAMSRSVRTALSKMPKIKVLSALLDCHIRTTEEGRKFITAKNGLSEGLTFNADARAASVAAYEEVVAF